MRVAGIDPSLSNFGMAKGTLNFSGASPVLQLETLQLQESQANKAQRKVVRKNSDDLERARTLYSGLQDFIQDVDLIFVEVPVGSQSARSMASYGICIGVLASIEKPLIQVTPTEVKVAATGSRTASKADMIAWATAQYPNAPWLKQGERITNKNEHLADAVAAIHAGIQTDTFKQLMAFRQTG
jgi:Holliday junction resolvasome RuvABC endonuclease subunit